MARRRRSRVSGTRPKEDRQPQEHDRQHQQGHAVGDLEIEHGVRRVLRIVVHHAPRLPSGIARGLGFGEFLASPRPCRRSAAACCDTRGRRRGRNIRPPARRRSPACRLGAADPLAIMLDGAGDDAAAGVRPARRLGDLAPRRPQHGQHHEPAQGEEGHARQEGLLREIAPPARRGCADTLPEHRQRSPGRRATPRRQSR